MLCIFRPHSYALVTVLLGVVDLVVYLEVTTGWRSGSSVFAAFAFQVNEHDAALGRSWARRVP